MRGTRSTCAWRELLADNGGTLDSLRCANEAHAVATALHREHLHASRHASRFKVEAPDSNFALPITMCEECIKCDGYLASVVHANWAEELPANSLFFAALLRKNNSMRSKSDMTMQLRRVVHLLLIREDGCDWSAGRCSMLLLLLVRSEATASE